MGGALDRVDSPADRERTILPRAQGLGLPPVLVPIVRSARRRLFLRIKARSVPPGVLADWFAERTAGRTMLPRAQGQKFLLSVPIRPRSTAEALVWYGAPGPAPGPLPAIQRPLVIHRHPSPDG